MAELISRDESDDEIEYVYKTNPDDVDAIRVTVHKTDPPSWCIQQNTGQTWQQIVEGLDTDLGVT